MRRMEVSLKCFENLEYGCIGIENSVGAVE